jgi:uncharacterized protein (DUF2141 family)
MRKMAFMILLMALMVGTAPAATLTVEVSNSDRDQGCLAVALYNLETRENFGSGRGYYQGQKANITNGGAKVIFSGIPEGTYAVAAFHDADCSGNLKKNFWGIPQEMYGFSNNYGKRPDFHLASFPVTGDTEIAIRLQWY